MIRRRTAHAAVVVLGVIPGLVLAAPASATPADQVWLSFGDATVGQPLATVTNAGTLAAETRQSVVTLNGGSLTVGGSVPGQGTSADFPAFSASSTGRRAIIKVTNSGTTDRLAPGTARFEFGADVVIDATNASGASGSTDNGNNVIQRGLYNDASQFKLQVDARRPSCRIKGSSGAVEVTSRTNLTPDTQWYRLTCVRTVGSPNDTVTLQVTPIAADGARGTTVSDARSGPVGRAAYAIGIPLSVGGKLKSNGTVNSSASDQFNGRIDNAVLRIG
jgi:hypothetical protein